MQELADAIHLAYCDEDCAKYTPGRVHYEFYAQRARNLLDELAPLIGSANVYPCVMAVMRELA